MHLSTQQRLLDEGPYTAVFTALGTVNQIRIFASRQRESAKDALRLAQERVEDLHRRLTVFSPDSEIALFNAAAGGAEIPISRDAMMLLRESKRYSAVSGGAFSITTRPVSALWRIHARCGSVPTRVEVEQALALVNDRDIQLDWDAQTARLRLPGQSVDFGAIAKGYAADEVRRILLEGGVTSALINLGGTVAVIGEVRHVGIQHPESMTGIAMGRVSVQDRCAVTSGDYERYYEVDGVRYHHILDPRTGYPSRSGLRSVTLIGESALAMDALSTAVFVLGAKDGAQLVREAGAEAVFVDYALNVFCTEGLRGDLELLQA